MKGSVTKTTHSSSSQLKVHQMFNAISQTIMDFHRGKFSGFKDASVFPLYRQWSVPSCSLLTSCLYLRLLNAIYQSTSLTPAISKSFLEIESACGVDHRSQQSCRSRQLKTNMVGWYHLICWTPLSSKISLYSPLYPHAPTLQTRLTLSLYTLWGKSLCVEAGSECKPLLWCNRTPQQVVWSCFGPEKPF